MAGLLDIFIKFFMLGLVSFGGPAAHLGYFYRSFVTKYHWLDEKNYTQIVALSQFLPGPSSSQVGFTIGYQRSGVFGGIAAFLGFTLPSVILMLSLFFVGEYFVNTMTFKGAVYGLKLLAVVVVFDAIITMGKSFCRQWYHQVIALSVALSITVYGSSYLQLVFLLLSAIVGYFFIPSQTTQIKNPLPTKPQLFQLVNYIALVLFILLLLSPFVILDNVWLGIFNDFYQAGSLVFGGGHVVLPLLQQSVGDSMSQEQFLMGYAAAQAVPGPMFTLATFLGAQLNISAPIISGLLATLAIFLPGFLLIVAFNNAWQYLAEHLNVVSAMMAVNAAVVGLLVAAFYHPIITASLHSIVDVIAVVIGFCLLKFIRVPVVILVFTFVTLGVLLVQVNF